MSQHSTQPPIVAQPPDDDRAEWYRERLHNAAWWQQLNFVLGLLSLIAAPFLALAAAALGLATLIIGLGLMIISQIQSVECAIREVHLDQIARDNRPR